MNTYQNWVIILGVFLIGFSAWHNWKPELQSLVTHG